MIKVIENQNSFHCQKQSKYIHECSIFSSWKTGMKGLSLDFGFPDWIWKIVDFFLDKFKTREEYHVNGARSCHGNSQSCKFIVCQIKFFFGPCMTAKLTTIHPSVEKLNWWQCHGLSLRLGQTVSLVMGFGRINWIYLDASSSVSTHLTRQLP